MSKKIPDGPHGSTEFLRSELNRPLDSRAAVRAWLVDGGSPSARTADGEPAWAVVLAQAPPDAVDELINAGADLNVRALGEQGWLLRCLEAQVDPWLALTGLRRLDHTWWEPDVTGRSPFHDARLSVPVAQAMGARWWTEGRPWSRLLLAEQTPAQFATHAGRPDLARVWHLWSSRSLFAGRRTDVQRQPPARPPDNPGSR